MVKREKVKEEREQEMWKGKSNSRSVVTRNILSASPRSSFPYLPPIPKGTSIVQADYVVDVYGCASHVRGG